MMPAACPAARPAACRLAASRLPAAVYRSWPKFYMPLAADPLVVVPSWDPNITCSTSFDECVAQSRALLSQPLLFEHKGESHWALVGCSLVMRDQSAPRSAWVSCALAIQAHTLTRLRVCTQVAHLVSHFMTATTRSPTRSVMQIT